MALAGSGCIAQDWRYTPGISSRRARKNMLELKLARTFELGRMRLPGMNLEITKASKRFGTIKQFSGFRVD